MLRMPKTPLFSGRRDLVYVESDFDGYVTGDEWTGGGDTGAVTVLADVAGGVVQLATTALDNDETWLHTTQELFRFGLVGSTILRNSAFEALIRYTEITADTANVFVGMMNALATTPFQDDGAGPKADFCGYGFYRLDGGVVWNTIVDNLTDFDQLTQALTLANTRNLAGEKVDADEDTVYRLRAECKPVCLKSATVLNLDFDFWINDIHLVHENCDMTIANFTNMHFGMAIHAGDGQILQLHCDCAGASQLRFPIEVATV